MRKKIFYFNDGLDGVVLAKSLNQAIGILIKAGYSHVSKAEIHKGIKTGEEQYNGSWGVDWVRCKRKGESRVLGWCE